MRRLLQRFRKDDDGAVTVDWVVLTAGVIGLGVAAAGIIVEAASPQAENLGEHLKNKTVGL